MDALPLPEHQAWSHGSGLTNENILSWPGLDPGREHDARTAHVTQEQDLPRNVEKETVSVSAEIARLRAVQIRHPIATGASMYRLAAYEEGHPREIRTKKGSRSRPSLLATCETQNVPLKVSAMWTNTFPVGLRMF